MCVHAGHYTWFVSQVPVGRYVVVLLFQLCSQRRVINLKLYSFVYRSYTQAMNLTWVPKDAHYLTTVHVKWHIVQDLPSPFLSVGREIPPWPYTLTDTQIHPDLYILYKFRWTHHNEHNLFANTVEHFDHVDVFLLKKWSFITTVNNNKKKCILTIIIYYLSYYKLKVHINKLFNILNSKKNI